MKSDETRDAALAKMAAFKIKLGFPDEWIDYSTFTPLSTDSFVECGCKATAFLIERELKEMNAPTDRVKWLMTPQTINAYYHPSLNEIVFPAAILQPPFFNPEADAAVNYGAMGAIVGHEMTVCVCLFVVCLFVCLLYYPVALSLSLSLCTVLTTKLSWFSSSLISSPLAARLRRPRPQIQSRRKHGRLVD